MNRRFNLALFFVANCFFALAVQAQTTAFTYQGRLTDGTGAANGSYQMQFSLFGSAAGTDQIGTTLTFDGNGGNPAPVEVANGVFTVQLNFGAAPAFDGNDRWLQIAVKKAADASYTVLNPRQQITSTPYSIRTLSATTADALSAACNGCVTNAQIGSVDGSKVTGTIARAGNADDSQKLGGVAASSYLLKNGDGSQLTNLNASNITTGTLGVPLNQSATSVFSSGAITVLTSSGGSQIPGLTQTITVTSGDLVYISTDGGIQTTSASATGYSEVNIVLMVDGSLFPNGGWRRVTAVNSGGKLQNIANWSMALAAQLSAGSHTIAVFALPTGNGSSAIVGGDNSTFLQAELTVMKIRK